MIQSGDLSRAVQLTAAAISVIRVIAYEKSTESQAHDLAERRITVKICCDETLPMQPLPKKLIKNISGRKSNYLKFKLLIESIQSLDFD